MLLIPFGWPSTVKMSLIQTSINFQRRLEAFYTKTGETIMPKSAKQEKSQKPRYKKGGRRGKGHQDLWSKGSYRNSSQYLAPNSLGRREKMIMYLSLVVEYTTLHLFILFQFIGSLRRANKLLPDPEVIFWKLTLA